MNRSQSSYRPFRPTQPIPRKNRTMISPSHPSDGGEGKGRGGSPAFLVLVSVLTFLFPMTFPSFASDATTDGSQGSLSFQASGPILLPHFEPDLPLAPGRGAFMVICVSCHSARYVTMQPLFPERQWKDTVDKMVKVYGAQMDSQQRDLIVQYLVKIHGPDSARAVPPADDDIGDSVAASVPAFNPVEPAPLLKLAGSPPDRDEEVKWGAEVFKRNCAGCHGPEGRGDGWIAPALLRKPKNLSATRFSLRALSDALWNGKPGTTMPSWRALPQTNLTSVAAYVQRLYQPGNADAPVSTESMNQGERIFQQNCAVCHGVHGEGNGPAAATLSPAPANFKLKQPNPDYLLQVLSEGIPGTAMPSWTQQISDPDRKALSSFIRSLFDPAGSGAH